MQYHSRWSRHLIEIDLMFDGTPQGVAVFKTPSVLLLYVVSLLGQSSLNAEVAIFLHIFLPAVLESTYVSVFADILEGMIKILGSFDAHLTAAKRVFLWKRTRTNF